jgi:Pentapeptide repeats (8 copies)
MATPSQKRLVQKRLADIREANNARFKWFKWTGFSGMTLRDWIGALATPVTILIAIAGLLWGVYTFNTQQANDHLKSIDEQQQTTLETYLDRMSDLLFTNKLGESKLGDEVRQVARARTITALQNLNPARKGILLQFLYESRLISRPHTTSDKVNPILSMSDANLSGADLRNAKLFDTDLSGADLSGADLSGADLTGINLEISNLSGAHLENAQLSSNLDFANLIGSNLKGAYLENANLDGADLHCASLSGAHLENAHLSGADLMGTDLSGADLQNAQVEITPTSGGVGRGGCARPHY